MEEEIVIPEIKVVDINWLKADGDNPNVMSEIQKNSLKENLKKHGFIVPIICNKEGLIADGQTRWEAAKELGMKQVLALPLDLKDVDRRMLRQILNKLKGEHLFTKDVAEYEKILQEQGLKDLSKLIGMDEQYFLDVIASKEFKPEEYLELKETIITKNNILDEFKVIKLNLTEEQKKKILEKLKTDEKKLFQIQEYFIMVD